MGKRGPKRRQVFDRAIEKVDASGDCWEWIAGLNNKGYGVIGAGGKYGRKLIATRVIYEGLIGKIPDGLELDHLCKNTVCVNPHHLEPVTHRENIIRGKRRHLTGTCKNGHTNWVRTKAGTRRCNSCHNDSEKSRRAKDAFVRVIS